MSYLEELYKLSEMNKRNPDYNYAQRVIMVEMIQEKIEEEQASEDYFIRFFEDVIGGDIEFDFQNVLSAIAYKSASDDAEACISVVPRISQMKPNNTVHSWIISALKYTDQLALHYIQEILGIIPIKDPDHGVERSMYIQINSNGYSAHVAGRILNNLYDLRNKLEHRVKIDPAVQGRKVLVQPDFRSAQKKIQKNFPKALLSFRKAFTEFYD